MCDFKMKLISNTTFDHGRSRLKCKGKFTTSALWLFMCIAFLTLLLSFVPEASAQWRRANGPFGGFINCLTESNGILLAGTSSGIFRSTNDGDSWTAALPGNIASLAGSGNTFFSIIATGDWPPSKDDGMYRSSDGGVNWSSLYNTSELKDWENIGSLSAFTDRAGVAHVYAAGCDGLFSSSDNGSSWSIVARTDTICFWSIMAIPDSAVPGGAVFFASTWDGASVSADGGRTWRILPLYDRGIHDLPMAALPPDSSKPGILYFGGWGYGLGIHRSTDYGLTWNAIDTGAYRESVTSLAARRRKDGGVTLFAGVKIGGMLCSTDGGKNWTSMNAGYTSPNPTALLITPDSTETVYAGSKGAGVFRSRNNGALWTGVNNGMTDVRVQALHVSAAGLYAGTVSIGAFRSVDGGATWSDINNGLTDTNVNAFAETPNPDGSTNLFAGIWAGVCHSTDGGSTWKECFASRDVVNALAVRVNSNGGTDLFAGCHTGGICLSTNNGKSWNYGSYSFGIYEVRSLSATATDLFVGSEYGVFRFSDPEHWDNPAGWTNLNNGLPVHYVHAVLLNPFEPGVLFAGTEAGLCQSLDNGASWRRFGLNGRTAQCLLFHGNDLFAGTRNGVFLATNNSNYWIDVNDGIENFEINALAIKGDTLFAGTQGGLWMRSITELKQTPPQSFLLEQNYPNPAGLTTNIPIRLPLPGFVSLKIFDLFGREVATLSSGEMSAGSYIFSWNTAAFPSGVYLCRLQTGSSVATRTLEIVK